MSYYKGKVRVVIVCVINNVMSTQYVRKQNLNNSNYFDIPAYREY